MKIWIFDDHEDRGKILCQQIRDLGYKNVEAHLQVYDIQTHLSAEYWHEIVNKCYSVQQDEVVFIHANNVAQFFWRDFVKEKCITCWVIMYAGNGVDEQIVDDNEILDGGISKNRQWFPYEPSVGDDAKAMWHLREFLEAVKNNDPFPFDKLIFKHVRLECWLEFVERLYLNAFTEETYPILNEWIDRLGRVIDYDGDTVEKKLLNKIRHHLLPLKQTPDQVQMRQIAESLEWLSKKERESFNLEDYL